MLTAALPAADPCFFRPDATTETIPRTQATSTRTQPMSCPNSNYWKEQLLMQSLIGAEQQAKTVSPPSSPPSDPFDVAAAAATPFSYGATPVVWNSESSEEDEEEALMLHDDEDVFGAVDDLLREEERPAAASYASALGMCAPLILFVGGGDAMTASPPTSPGGGSVAESGFITERQ